VRLAFEKETCCLYGAYPLSRDEYRFRSPKRFWRAQVITGDGSEYMCVLQVAIMPKDRTLEKVALDLQDASDAAAYASRFNLHNQQTQSDPLPSVKVAAPVACTVQDSAYPSMIPVGTVCTLTTYAYTEAQKFVFDGTEDFLELPQSFFHYATFSSNGRHFVCDVQGVEEDNGDILLVDPVILRAVLPGVDDIVRAAIPTPTRGFAEIPLASGPTSERFDTLHKKCSQLCHSFDPQRKSVKRNVGLCGIGAACGLLK